MSAHTKKPSTNNHVEIIVQNKRYIVPRSVIIKIKLFSILKQYNVTDDKDDLIPADKVFKSFDQKYGKVGTIIQGCRYRDDMTQKQLAAKLKINQSHISQIENGKRTVGKKLAQKLAKVFNTDYRLFL